MPRLTRAVAVAALALIGGACSDAGPNTSQLSFNSATKPGPAAVKGAAFGIIGTPETYTDGSNTLVIDKVELVLREIELHRASATTDCATGVADDCEELEIGSTLVDVPLGTPGAARAFSVELAPGTYDKVEFKLHKPSSSDDAAFIQAHPEMDGVSVRVTGTYNGTDFVYTGEFDAEMEFELSSPLVANETGATDLTLFLDLDKWFRDSGGTLVNPASANSGQPNQGVVEENIKGSLDAFEDHDHDGRDDGPSHL